MILEFAGFVAARGEKVSLSPTRFVNFSQAQLAPSPHTNPVNRPDPLRLRSDVYTHDLRSFSVSGKLSGFDDNDDAPRALTFVRPDGGMGI